MEWSIFISGAALVVSLLSFRAARQANVSQHAPYLRAWIAEEPEALTLWIENKGNGPAIVSRLEVLEPGSPDNRLVHALWYYHQKDVRKCADRVQPGYAIAKDEQIDLLVIDLGRMDYVDKNQAFKSISALKLKLSYSTMRQSTHVFEWPDPAS